MRHLWEAGPSSRSGLAAATGLAHNEVGRIAGELIARELVREGRPAAAAGRGRPPIPLHLNAPAKRVLAVTITPGRVQSAQVDLCGHPVGKVNDKRIDKSNGLVRAARSAIARGTSDGVIAVGLSVPGLIDADSRRLLLSSAVPGAEPLDLRPLIDAAGDLPLVAQNDMHALAAQWLTARRLPVEQDTLLVRVEDGELGAAMIVHGRPNRGSIWGSNELGHTRLPVETERCYCGHSGCLERICSTKFLRRLDRRRHGTLARRAAEFTETDTALARVVELLATGIANAVNFVRPHRLVLIGSLMRHHDFADALVAGIRAGTLHALVERLRVDRRDPAETLDVEPAGWLALAELYLGEWSALPVGRRP